MCSGSNKSIETGEPKVLSEFRFGGHEGEKKSEERIPLKVWKMLTPEARISIWSGEEVNIGLVRDGVVKEIKRGGGNIS